VKDVTAFAIAGGRSRRMGRDKALLPWGDSTLLEHALGRLRQLSDDVRILCGPQRRYEDRGVPVVIDAAAESGALVALLSGLLVLERPLGLFLATDLPLVPVELLRHLISLASETDAVVPAGVRGPEPLCAVYTRECLAPIQAAVARGDLKMTSFWEKVRIRAVPHSELRGFGDPERLFLNLNSPEDYARALAANPGPP
jgi:molybdopterin-guanine dinucleotide biosynthesis protein A